MNESWNVETQSYGTGQRKQNIFLGIIGAIVGGLIGSILWIVIYQLGFLAAIAGIAIAWCACKGYALLSKGNDMKAAVIPTIIALIVVTLANYFSWGLEIYILLSEEIGITIMEAMKMVPKLAFDSENVVYFFRDMGIGFITVGIGASPFIKKVKAANAQRVEI